MLNAIKNLLAMGLPMAAMRFLHTFQTFIVMLLLAQLGHDVLAASFSIAMTRIVMLVIFMSPLFALGPIVSRQFAQGNLDAVSTSSLIQQSWVGALLLALVPLTLLTFIEPILTALHQPADVIPIISSYFHYYMWAIPIIYLGTVNYQFVSGIKQQYWALILGVINLCLSISLNYGLIFGHFGFPKMGVAGAGLASIISTTIGFMLSTVLLTRVNHFRFTITSWNNFKWGKTVFKVGWPISLRTASELLMMFVIMIMVGWLGNIAMSASQISNEYLLLAQLPLFGLSEACAIVVGHTIGKNNQLALKQLSTAALMLACGFTLIVACVFGVFHHPLADAFIDFTRPEATQIYHLAMMLLLLRIINMIIKCPITIYTGLLRGLFDTKYPMWISILTSWLLTLPLAALLGFGFKWGVIGIVLASSLTNLLIVILLLLRWRKQI